MKVKYDPDADILIFILIVKKQKWDGSILRKRG